MRKLTFVLTLLALTVLSCKEVVTSDKQVETDSTKVDSVCCDSTEVDSVCCDSTNVDSVTNK